MNSVNAIMARANKTNGELADMKQKVADSGGLLGGNTGIHIMGGGGPTADEIANKEKTDRWAIDDAIKSARSIGGRAATQLASGLIAAQTARRGQDIGAETAIAQQNVTARGQDINANSDVNRNQVAIRGQDIHANSDAARIGIEQGRLGIEGERTGILKAADTRAEKRSGIETGILQGQADDAGLLRGARGELNAAITTGDMTKIEAAKAKVIAAGGKFDKPNNEFTAVTDNMGINVTRTNKDTGAVDIINPKTGAVTSIAAPGAKMTPQQEHQSALQRAGNDAAKIKAINDLARKNGVIQ
jgi:hypothetical protein